MGPQLSEEDRRHLAAVVDGLTRRFEGTASRETVERLVDDSLARFGNARITMHVPVLVERLTCQRLKASSQAEPESYALPTLSRSGL
jgi:hypothetical protein